MGRESSYDENTDEVVDDYYMIGEVRVCNNELTLPMSKEPNQNRLQLNMKFKKKNNGVLLDTVVWIVYLFLNIFWFFRETLHVISMAGCESI